MRVAWLSVAALLASASLPGFAHAEVTFFSSALGLVEAASSGCQTSDCFKQPQYFEQNVDPAGGPVSASRTYTFDEGTATATARSSDRTAIKTLLRGPVASGIGLACGSSGGGGGRFR